MAIDKSLSQYYDVPGTKKIKGQLHKLAYITPKEAKALKKMGGKEVITDSGIPAYPPQGRAEQHGGRSSSRGGNGSHDRGGGQHRAAAASAPKSKPKSTPPPGEKGGAGYVEPTPKYTPPPGEKGGPGYVEPKIDTGPKKDILPEFKKRGITTVTGGGPHTEGPIDRIVYQPTDLPKRTYDPRTDPNALLDRGGGILKGLGTAAASVFLPMLLPAKAAAAYKMYNTAKTASAYAKKFGVTDTDVVQSLTNKVLDKDILKQASKDDIPKVADRHPGTGKKKRTFHEGKGDGVSRILPETLQSAVSEGTQQFLSDEMKEQYTVAQNKMKAALASGYYTDQDGRQIQLSDEQVNALTQWVTKIDSMLVDPVMMADGGRVDKALGGRVRDI